jgi:hypothetical protein
MAATARSVVTVERDPDRAAIASRRLESLPNVEFLVSDWRDLVPSRHACLRRPRFSRPPRRRRF